MQSDNAPEETGNLADFWGIDADIRIIVPYCHALRSACRGFDSDFLAIVQKCRINV
jgi:hypothetical protein